MPLTLQRPTRDMFLPLLQKIENRLAGWRGKLISRGGQLQLINSVLSSIPIYMMACFQFPKWVMDRIDRMRRVFLWGRNDSALNPISLINWSAVCLPKAYGGLGIADLELRNISLIIRWWWRLHADPDSLWALVATRLRSITFFSSQQSG